MHGRFEFHPRRWRRATIVPRKGEPREHESAQCDGEADEHRDADAINETLDGLERFGDDGRVVIKPELNFR